MSAILHMSGVEKKKKKMAAKDCQKGPPASPRSLGETRPCVS